MEASTSSRATLGDAPVIVLMRFEKVLITLPALKLIEGRLS